MDWLKHIIFAVCMVIMYFSLNRYRKNNLSLSSGAIDSYIVSMPALLKGVYSVIFAIGLILYSIFLFCYIKQLGGVTKGHLWFAFIFSLVGLAIILFSNKWKIEVVKEQISISTAFKKNKIILISDMEKVKIGNKGELYLYFQGEKLTTVDAMCNNYDKLCDTFEKYGKF